MIHHIPAADQLTICKFSRFFGPADWQFSSPLNNCNIGRRSLSAFYNLGVFYHSPGRSIWGGSADRSKRKAAFGAMGEALERYCLGEAKADFLDKNYEELVQLGHRTLDPNSYRHYADDQDVLIQGEVRNIDRQTRLHWTWFEDALNENTPTLLPSLFNRPYPGPKPIFFGGTTNGNGCGQTPAHAKLSGLQELLERDAIMVYWWTRNTPRQIDLSSPSPELRKILETFADLLPHIDIFWTKTDFDLTTVMVAYRGRLANRNPYFQITGATRLDPLHAMDRALGEMVSLHQHFESTLDSYEPIEFGSNYDLSIWEFLDHVHLYAYHDMREAYDFWFPANPDKVHWSELPNRSTGSHEGDLGYILNEFRRNGHRLYFAELTTQPLRASDLHVYRAYSPDLVEVDAGHKYRALGSSRYYTLHKKLNLKMQPANSRALNPYPHPFP